MVRPVFIVELMDSADFLQEERSAGTPGAGLCCQGDTAAAVSDPAAGAARGSWRLQTSPAPIRTGGQRLEVQFADGRVRKGALPLRDIFDVTCWPHLSGV